jgi:hypothetical protein
MKLTSITPAQMAAILDDAIEVLTSREIAQNHNNNFTFVSGIIIVPENVNVSYNDGTVTIINNPSPISVGQNFIVFFNGLPVAYSAQNVSISGNVTRISAVEIDVSVFVEAADVQGVIEADLSLFEPYNDDAALSYIVGGTLDMDFLDGIEHRSFASISPASTINAIMIEDIISLGPGRSVSVTGVISNVRANYRGNLLRREAYLSITGNTSVSVSANFDLAEAAGNRATLGELRIKGVGVIRVFFEVSLEGSVSITFESNFRIGFQYSPQGGFSAIRHFTERRSSIEGGVTVSAYLEIEAGIDIFFASATVYARLGARASYTVENYNDNTPPRCTTFRAYIFVRVGARATLFNLFTRDAHHYFWNDRNSPVRKVQHFEDGRIVSRCTHGNTTSNYFTSAYSRFGGFAGGQGLSGNWRGGTVTVVSQPITFECPNFEAAVREVINKPTGNILRSDVANVRNLQIPGRSITSLAGIEYFVALETLNVNNNQLTTLDVSNNLALRELSAEFNLNRLSPFIRMSSLNVSNNPMLHTLRVSSNHLTSLDISNCPALINLYVRNNQLTILDVSSNLELIRLDFSSNKLEEIDLSKNEKLRFLNAKINRLTKLDISINPLITYLDVTGNRMESEAAILGLDNLRENFYRFLFEPQFIGEDSTITFYCHNFEAVVRKLISKSTEPIFRSDVFEIVSLFIFTNTDINDLTGIEHFTMLEVLSINNNQLTTLDVSNNPMLRSLYVEYNYLTNLVLHPTAPYEIIDVRQNNLPHKSAITGRESNPISWDTGSFRFSPQRAAKPTQPTPGAPVLASKTSTSVTLNAIIGAEFAMNTVDSAPAGSSAWQDEVLFEGLTPSSTYYFFARMKETATHMASPASTSISVTTDAYEYTLTPSPAHANLPDAFWFADGGISGYAPVAPMAEITFTNDGNSALEGLEVSLGNDDASGFVLTHISADSDLTTPAANAAITESIAPESSFTVTIEPKDELNVGNHMDELIIKHGSLLSDVVVPISFTVIEPIKPKVLPFHTSPLNRQVVRPVMQDTLTIPFDSAMKHDVGLIKIVSGKGHDGADMTFNLSSPSPATLEWEWNNDGDVLVVDLTSHPAARDGHILNYYDTYIVVVSGFISSFNVQMDEFVFSFMTSRENTNSNIRRIDVKGMRAEINNATRIHTIEIPHFYFDLDSITANDFNILLDSTLSSHTVPIWDGGEWQFNVWTDYGIPETAHTVKFKLWGEDTAAVDRGFNFNIDYMHGTVELGRANRTNEPNKQGLWYFVANNQRVVPGASNFVQLPRNHSGILDLNTHLNASTVAATRTLHILDWTGTNARPNAAQFAQAIRDGKLISIPLLRRATAAELSNPGEWHYEYEAWEAISAAQDRNNQFGNPDRTVSLTGNIYIGADWEIRSSNSVANNNNLLARGTGIGKVNENLVDARAFDSFTVAERTRLSGNAARDVFVRLTGDQDKRLFASHVATLRIAADSAMTGNAGMSSANNVASFVSYAHPDPVNGTRAVWAVPDSRYDYEYIVRGTTPLPRTDGRPGTVAWSPTHPDVIDFGDWKKIKPGDELPDELFTYNTIANPQFHVRRLACAEKNHPRSSPSVAFRFAPLRANVNLAANSLNINTMSITGRSTAQEYIVLGKPYEELRLGEAPRGSVVNPNTDPNRDNRIANQSDIIQGWTRSPGTSLPIRPEWVTAGAYIYVRTAATAAAPARMVGNLERRNSNVSNPLQLINPPINFENVAPRDFLFGLSDPDRDRVVGRLFVFNTTTGRFSLNTLANFPNEARIYGYTDRSAIQISSNNEFWVAPGTSDLRPYMNIEDGTATLWVRIAGGTGIRPSVPMKLHIDIRTGIITSAER